MKLFNKLAVVSNNLKIVEKLNEMLSLDKEFTEKMVSTRYLVNEAYANSNFGCLEDESGKCFSGLVGVLNGLITCNDKYTVAVNYNDNKLINFSLFTLNDGKN